MKKTLDTCRVKEPWKFLFWSGVTEYIEHDWLYISKTKRICDKCKRKELLYSNYEFEDWRKMK
jgi:hypothetical protein